MKLCSAAAVLFLLPLLSWAQDRRLESVTWEPGRRQLTWVVAEPKAKETKDGKDGKESKDEGKTPSKAKLTYRIEMSDATMTVNGETRRFSAQEAVTMQRVMDFVSRYAVESVIWWEKGMGDPIGKEERVDNRTAPSKEDAIALQAFAQLIAASLNNPPAEK
jgi:hypothetical protein